jgi:mRNA-degrading endonuclease RelE of RelBE toxin-antitoxin system
VGEKQPHRWLIEWSEESLESLQKLSSKDKMAVFDSVEHLAKAENPYSVPGVKKLKASQDKRRIRAGDYRIIFRLETGEIVHLEFTYKGKLQIYGIFIHHKGY